MSAQLPDQQPNQQEESSAKQSKRGCGRGCFRAVGCFMISAVMSLAILLIGAIILLQSIEQAGMAEIPPIVIDAGVLGTYTVPEAIVQRLLENSEPIIRWLESQAQ